MQKLKKIIIFLWEFITNDTHKARVKKLIESNQWDRFVTVVLPYISKNIIAYEDGDRADYITIELARFFTERLESPTTTKLVLEHTVVVRRNFDSTGSIQQAARQGFMYIIETLKKNPELLKQLFKELAG